MDPIQNTGAADLATDDFDLDSYAYVQSADVVIKHPLTGQPTPVVITIASPEHPTRKRINMAAQRRLRSIISRTGKMPVTDPQEDADEELQTLVACTLGWRGVRIKGDWVDFSAAAAHALYSDSTKRWLVDQVRDAMNARETFTQRSVGG